MSPDGYLGKDTEHVFEVQEYDFTNPTPGATVTIWLPALRVRVHGEERLTHMVEPGQGSWATKPKLVRIDDIAHLLSPEQLADMRRCI